MGNQSDRYFDYFSCFIIATSSKNIKRKHPEGLKTNLAAVVKRRRSMRGWPLRQKDGQSIWEDLARLTSSPQNTPPTKIANTSAVRKKADKKGSDLKKVLYLELHTKRKS